VKVIGLVGVPEPTTVTAVVPTVSVNTPVVLTLIMFPLLSLALADPPEELYGAFTIVPFRAVTVSVRVVVLVDPVTISVYPDPSVACDVNPVEEFTPPLHTEG